MCLLGTTDVVIFLQQIVTVLSLIATEAPISDSAAKIFVTSGLAGTFLYVIVSSVRIAAIKAGKIAFLFGAMAIVPLRGRPPLIFIDIFIFQFFLDYTHPVKIKILRHF